MIAQLLDGVTIAQKIKLQLKETIAKKNLNPGLAVILVGDNPASQAYIRQKQKGCNEIGIISTLYHLPEDTTQSALEKLIKVLNNDPKIHGILLQLPLPNQLKMDDILEKIDPKKDVDGFHPYNLGRLVQKRPVLRPCTPFGVMVLLKETGVDLTGKHAVVVGASNIVGRPMALELLMTQCTVTICHSKTKNLSTHIAHADILISATGFPGIIKSEWIKSGAIVIDVGFSRLDNGTISGDIDFQTAKERASFITPVPGGVGPMTVATLLQNTVHAASL